MKTAFQQTLHRAWPALAVALLCLLLTSGAAAKEEVETAVDGVEEGEWITIAPQFGVMTFAESGLNAAFGYGFDADVVIGKKKRLAISMMTSQQGMENAIPGEEWDVGMKRVNLFYKKYKKIGSKQTLYYALGPSWHFARIWVNGRKSGDFDAHDSAWGMGFALGIRRRGGFYAEFDHTWASGSLPSKGKIGKGEMDYGGSALKTGYTFFL